MVVSRFLGSRELILAQPAPVRTSAASAAVCDVLTRRRASSFGVAPVARRELRGWRRDDLRWLGFVCYAESAGLRCGGIRGWTYPDSCACSTLPRSSSSTPMTTGGTATDGVKARTRTAGPGVRYAQFPGVAVSIDAPGARRRSRQLA
jgi:hypothetical protein